MLDKMAARCVALNVELGDKKYIDGACVLADNDGDKIFSTFDTRDVDKSQPEMNCGTHIIMGGTGKYKGITGKEPFACQAMPALAGPGGYHGARYPAQYDMGDQALRNGWLERMPDPGSVTSKGGQNSPDSEATRSEAEGRVTPSYKLVRSSDPH